MTYKDYNNKSHAGEILKARLLTEQALLGAILIESTATHSLAIRQVQSIINYQDFYDWRNFDNKNSRIFQSMLKCGHPDIVMVAQKLTETGTLRQGDYAYLVHLIAECPTSLDYLYYARAVRYYSRGKDTNNYTGLKL